MGARQVNFSTGRSIETLGVDSEAPVAARARDPTELLGDVDAGD
jgi:hypothetical protein